MADGFDPYHKWLGIPSHEQPPNHYRLLGIPPFESDHDVIDTAANRQLAHVRTYQSGKHAELSQRILNEISRARVVLLNEPAKVEYDSKLRKVQSAVAKEQSSNKPPSSVIELRDCLVNTEIVSEHEFATVIDSLPAKGQGGDVKSMTHELVKAGKLTKFQAAAVLQGQQHSLLLGEYIVLDKLGQGGMGQVLRAQHRRMKRIVALKIMSAAGLQQPDALKRFLREAQAAAKLHHPNIVTAFDANDHDGIHYLAMEYVDGMDLASTVHMHGRLPIDKAVDYIVQAAHGLQYAHDHGVVHRDIKPGNLLLDKQGVVRILDMGLARIDDPLGDAKDAGITRSGTIVGTVDYMAPEQAFDTRGANTRSDIYSLGCTLFFLLTGQSPARGETIMQKLLDHREGKPRPLRSVRAEVPEVIDQVYQRMVAKDAAKRYASCTEAADALQAALKAPAIPTTPTRSVSEGKPVTPRKAGEEKHVVVQDDPDLGLAVIPVEEDKPDSGLVRFMHSIANVSLLKPAKALQTSPSRPERQRRQKAANSWLFLSGVGVAVVVVLAVVIGMVRNRGRETADTPENIEPAKPSKATEPPKVTPAKVGPTPEKPVSKPLSPYASDSVDLLRLVDLQKHVVAGNWSKQPDGSLESSISDDRVAGAQRIEFPYYPPEEYDLVVEFTRAAGEQAVGQIFPLGQQQLTWLLGGWDNRLSGFELIDGASAYGSPLHRHSGLTTGKRHTSLLQIRRKTITAFLDGQVVMKLDRSFAEAGVAKGWILPDRQAIGFGGILNKVVLHKALVTRPSGRAEKDFVLLFNGKDLSGWKTEAGQWKVEAECIVAEPEAGNNWIETDKTFTDYELHLQYRLQGGDSGIRFRGGKPEVELNLANGEYHGTIMAFEPVQHLEPPRKEVFRPAGEWNDVRLTCVATHITAYINGELTQDVDITTLADGKATLAPSGPIGLQQCGDRVEFRNVWVRELTK